MGSLHTPFSQQCCGGRHAGGVPPALPQAPPADAGWEPRLACSNGMRNLRWRQGHTLAGGMAHPPCPVPCRPGNRRLPRRYFYTGATVRAALPFRALSLFLFSASPFQREIAARAKPPPVLPRRRLTLLDDLPLGASGNTAAADAAGGDLVTRVRTARGSRGKGDRTPPLCRAHLTPSRPVSLRSAAAAAEHGSRRQRRGAAWHSRRWPARNGGIAAAGDGLFTAGHGTATRSVDPVMRAHKRGDLSSFPFCITLTYLSPRHPSALSSHGRTAPCVLSGIAARHLHRPEVRATVRCARRARIQSKGISEASPIHAVSGARPLSLPGARLIWKTTTTTMAAAP